MSIETQMYSPDTTKCVACGITTLKKHVVHSLTLGGDVCIDRQACERWKTEVAAAQPAGGASHKSRRKPRRLEWHEELELGAGG